jgi:hypothetical protein
LKGVERTKEVEIVCSYLHAHPSLQAKNGSCGLGSSVGIPTGYGLDGPRIESRWGPPSLQCNGYRIFPGGRKQPGRDTDRSPLLVPRSKNRVELYRYSL